MAIEVRVNVAVLGWLWNGHSAWCAAVGCVVAHSGANPVKKYAVKCAPFDYSICCPQLDPTIPYEILCRNIFPEPCETLVVWVCVRLCVRVCCRIF